ncbi:hypothetical protein [Burkholderia oklahomensis]|uniref:hypothetical protein n=1 Tax=Burkholderia oklahomensis TaxID=342113 RepID=UPI00016A7F46|nr:hypothetical protein [Burkholderia oklahomensis]MBI0360274.1 hypothetical protein [Burkholderia oklahomensis]
MAFRRRKVRAESGDRAIVARAPHQSGRERRSIVAGSAGVVSRGLDRDRHARGRAPLRSMLPAIKRSSDQAIKRSSDQAIKRPTQSGSCPDRPRVAPVTRRARSRGRSPIESTACDLLPLADRPAPIDQPRSTSPD